jgi:hypothetical protein
MLRTFVVLQLLIGSTQATALAQAAPGSADRAAEQPSVSPADAAPAAASPPPAEPPPAAPPPSYMPLPAPVPDAYEAPPGYGPPPPDTALLRRELAQLERERAEMSLGGPIAMLIAGGVTLGTGASLLLLGALANDYCGSTRSSCNDNGAGTITAIGGIATLAGGVLAVAGLVMLLDRAGERRRLGLRIKQIRRDLEWSGETFGVALDSGRASFSVRLRI